MGVEATSASAIQLEHNNAQLVSNLSSNSHSCAGLPHAEQSVCKVMKRRAEASDALRETLVSVPLPVRCSSQTGAAAVLPSFIERFGTVCRYACLPAENTSLGSRCVLSSGETKFEGAQSSTQTDSGDGAMEQ